MIEAAERDGRLKPGGLIVEATSATRGGARARRRGEGLSLHFHHARQDVAGEGAAAARARRRGDHHADRGASRPSENYIMKGRAIAAAHPNAIFADQHYNPVNPEVHYRTTGPELWQQTSGKITHFVCAPGTAARSAEPAGS